MTLILNRDYYAAWRVISNDAVRYWTRLLLDGLHSSAHPEWAFNPLTLSGLGRLWALFAPAAGKPDKTQSQRRAIRVLASRRALLADGQRFPCPTGYEEPEWNDYWAQVSNANTTFRGELFQQMSTLLRATGPPNYGSILNTTAVFAGELLLTGYSDFELFNRASGILDPQGMKAMPHVDRALGLLDHLMRAPTNEFVVSTDLLQNGRTLSHARRIAGRELQSALEWPSGDGFVKLGGSVKIISRITSTHSRTAFMNHRLVAWELLRKRSAKLRLTGLTLAEESLVHPLSNPNHEPWRHGAPRVTVYQYLQEPDPAIEPGAFSASIELVNEDPEETVRLLCDAFERRLGTDWPKLAGHAYIKQLRAAIGRRLVSAIQETQGRWKGDSAAPTWVHGLARDSRLNFAQVASSIRQSGSDMDWLLAERFDLAGQQARYFTPGLVIGWLYLAKGIRNREVHAGAWPLDLRCISSFMARLLLHAFVATFPARGKS